MYNDTRFLLHVASEEAVTGHSGPQCGTLDGAPSFFLAMVALQQRWPWVRLMDPVMESHVRVRCSCADDPFPVSLST